MSVDSSPAVSAGVVYVATDDFCVHAINASAGVELWNHHTGSVISLTQHSQWMRLHRLLRRLCLQPERFDGRRDLEISNAGLCGFISGGDGWICLRGL